MNQQPRVFALVPAAGSSTRIANLLRERGATSKTLLAVGGVTVIERTVRALVSVSRIETIVVLTRAEDRSTVEALFRDYPKVRVREGGATRSQSVKAGLQALHEGLDEETFANSFIVIHDAARCLVTSTLIERSIEAAITHKAVTCALPVTDTLKRVENGFVGTHVPREQTWSIQTPQVFHAPLLLQAHSAPDTEATDDSSLVQPLHPVHLLEGERTNLKITTEQDVLQAEALAAPLEPRGYLDVLAKRYGSDKSSDFHFFTRYYEEHFAPRRFEVQKVLEIGVYGGGSMKMWADFFPNATILGIDNDPQSFQSHTGCMRTFVGDQSSPDFLTAFIQKVGGNFDIIIDDGGHRMHEQLTSFKHLFPELRGGGIYVVEDLHTSYWDFCGGGDKRPGTMVEFIKNMIDDMNLHGRCDCGEPMRAMKAILEKQPNSLNYLEQAVKAIHLYKSLAFIYRH